MAENAPPATTTAAPDPSRGMPYYEKLRKDLRDALQKKRILDQNLASSPPSLSRLPTDSAMQASIEDSIYRLESAYLDDTTSAGGNIVRGFEGYLKGTAPGSSMAAGGGMGGGSGGGGGGGGGTATRRKGGVTDADRIFSRTSAAVSRVRLPPLPPPRVFLVRVCKGD
jgi:chromatin modification-related protein EAF6